MSNHETWISNDADGWAFWSAKPRVSNDGLFGASNGEQSEGVKLVNEFSEHAISCVINDGETAKVCPDSPVTIDSVGRFVVPVITSTIEGPA